MDTQSYRRIMFTAAAWWNWVAALLFMGMAALMPQLTSLFLNEPLASFLWFYLFFGLVAVLGWGYYLVAQDPHRNRNIIKLGVLGKLFVVAVIVGAWWTGQLTLLTVAAVAVDLVFALLFIGVLKKMPDTERSKAG